MTEIISTPIAAESGHWYKPDGTPAYEIVGANGKIRPTTLRDAKKLGLFTSVTSIIRLAAAPQLESWKRRQLALACLTLPRLPDESEDDFLARAERDSQEEARAARDRGTAIHAAIEQHYRGEPPDDDLFPWVISARNTLRETCGEQRWVAEHSFAHPAGYGGKLDLHSEQWVIDAKGKDGLGDLRLFDEHYMQLGAYRFGLNGFQRCGILFFDRNTPQTAFVEASPDDVIRGTRMFLSLLAYHRAKTGYAP